MSSYMNNYTTTHLDELNNGKVGHMYMYITNYNNESSFWQNPVDMDINSPCNNQMAKGSSVISSYY